MLPCSPRVHDWMPERTRFPVRKPRRSRYPRPGPATSRRDSPYDRAGPVRDGHHRVETDQPGQPLCCVPQSARRNVGHVGRRCLKNGVLFGQRVRCRHRVKLRFVQPSVRNTAGVVGSQSESFRTSHVQENQMATLSVQAASTPAGDLPDMPIEPSWIKDGNPVARGAAEPK